MDKRKTIMLFAPQSLPIPAVGGGAIETLITHLLNENEREGMVKLVVISRYDEKAASVSYQNSKIYYFQDGKLIGDKIRALKLKFLWLRVVTKLKRITKLLGIVIPSWNDDIVYLDQFHFQVYQIAKKEKINAIVNEGGGCFDQFEIFNKLLGKQNVYYHLHSVMEEDFNVRKIISNSISISEYVRDEWVKDKSIVGKNVVLYNGIEVNRFKEPVDNRKCVGLKEKLGLSPSDFIVFFCGRLIPEKGVDKLLEAMRMIKKRNIKLLLIGSVGFSLSMQTEYSKMIISKAEKMDSVIYLGYVPNEEMPQYYKLSDLVVVPSVWQEGVGLVTIEAMASGVPLVVTESGGMVEYVSDCAVKIPIDNCLSENLCNEIIKISENKELRNRMVQLGKERAEMYSCTNYYRNFVDIFL